MKKRLLALFLVLCMAVAILPVAALAIDDPEEVVIPGDDDEEVVIPGDDDEEEVIPGDDDEEEVVPPGDDDEEEVVPPGDDDDEGEVPEASDIPDGYWATESINAVMAAGLMRGTSENADGTVVFSPENSATRAMMVEVLYRAAGSPAVTFEALFDDVESDKWYATSVTWAAKEGITNGVTEDLFAPLKEITREQFVVLMYRNENSPAVNDTSNLDKFDDADQISAWAKDAMSWAVANNILLGDNHNKLSPLDGATRAEMAAMVARLLIPQAH